MWIYISKYFYDKSNPLLVNILIQQSLLYFKFTKELTQISRGERLRAYALLDPPPALHNICICILIYPDR